MAISRTGCRHWALLGAFGLAEDRHVVTVPVNTVFLLGNVKNETAHERLVFRYYNSMLREIPLRLLRLVGW